LNVWMFAERAFEQKARHVASWTDH
jgi:hypothetical protein